MYTKNSQIRISLLSYSHCSINFSFDVLYVCLDNVLFVNVDCGTFTIVLLLWKTNLFFKCCIFCESHPILMTRFLFSDHLCIVLESAWQTFMRHTLLDSGKVHGKYVFGLSTHFQCIHSNSFILSRGFTLIVLVLMGGKTDGQDLFWQKQSIVSIFFCSITCFWVYESEYKP